MTKLRTAWAAGKRGTDVSVVALVYVLLGVLLVFILIVAATLAWNRADDLDIQQQRSAFHQSVTDAIDLAEKELFLVGNLTYRSGADWLDASDSAQADRKRREIATAMAIIAFELERIRDFQKRERIFALEASAARAGDQLDTLADRLTGLDPAADESAARAGVIKMIGALQLTLEQSRRLAKIERGRREEAFGRDQIRHHVASAFAVGVTALLEILIVIQILGKISRALTSQRATSEALRTSERRFRNVVEGSIQGIIVHRDGVPLFANQAIANILGYRDADAIMALASIDEFVHEDDLAEAQERQRRRMVDPDGVPDRVEYRCRRPDGSVIFLECQATVIDWDGEPAIHAACYDISERKRAREEVRQLNEQLERRVEERTRELAREKRRAEEYLDAASTIFVVLDRDGNMILVNREACRVLGYGEDELIGKDFFTLCVDESERDSRRQRYLNAVAGDQPEADRAAPREVWVVTRSGQHRLIVWRDAPLRHDDGGVHAQLCSGTDITELRLAEDQLRQAHRSDALASLAGGIAHSLNNLLMPIGALTESALRQIPAGERNHERLSKVLQASRRAGDLVSRILAFSRRDEPGRVPRDIAELLDETLGLLHDLTPSTITLRSEIDADTGTVLTDPAQLESVIMNLVTNAAAAIGDGNGEISVTLRAETVAGEAASRRIGLAPGDYAHIVVRDNGPGIEPHVMQRIFDPFFTTKAVGQGTGLGLSIANSVVRQHGGIMRASSKPGSGTTFEIYLPLEQSLESVA